MTDINTTRVDEVLEELCEAGCGRVREIIEEIEQGEIPPAAQILNHAEQALLLEELSAVMNAYQRACPA